MSPFDLALGFSFSTFASEHHLVTLFAFAYTGLGCAMLLLKKSAELVEQAWAYYKHSRRSYLDFRDELRDRRDRSRPATGSP